jgi:hypothetical protein
MIRILIEKADLSHPKPLHGLIWYEQGKPVGTVRFLQSLPRKQGQKEYEWEEVPIE